VSLMESVFLQAKEDPRLQGSCHSFMKVAGLKAIDAHARGL
jgi:hypothetical protein